MIPVISGSSHHLLFAQVFVLSVGELLDEETHRSVMGQQNKRTHCDVVGMF